MIEWLRFHVGHPGGRRVQAPPYPEVSEPLPYLLERKQRERLALKACRMNETAKRKRHHWWWMSVSSCLCLEEEFRYKVHQAYAARKFYLSRGCTQRGSVGTSERRCALKVSGLGFCGVFWIGIGIRHGTYRWLIILFKFCLKNRFIQVTVLIQILAFSTHVGLFTLQRSVSCPGYSVP